MGRKIDIVSADGDQTTLGSKADSAATNHTSSWSAIALLKWVGQLLSTVVSGLSDGTQKTKITNGTNDTSVLQIGSQVASSDYGMVTNAVIHGKTTAGGGSYVDVKVNPSGSLAVDTGLSQPLTDTQLRASNVNVSIQNASIAATQSGTWNINNISGTISLPTGAATAANQTTANTSLSSIDGKLPSALVSNSLATTLRDASGNPIDFTSTVPVINTSQYPSGATALIATASGANSSATASLAGASGKTTYLVGYLIETQGATGASVVTPTVTGLAGGTTITRILQVVAGATTKNEVLTQTFNPAIPANAANTNIDVVCPALGAGNTRALVTVWGYRI